MVKQDLSKIIYEPATTFDRHKLKRKTILEYLPDVFKKLIDESKPNEWNNLQPNSVALTAKILDEIIAQISKDWSINIEQLLKEFKLTEVFGGSTNLFAINETNLLKGFFLFKGTKIDIEYILKVAGYRLKIFDYQRILRTPLEILPTNFKYNEDLDKYFYTNSKGVSKEIRNCELYAIIDADLTSNNFQGYNPRVLKVIQDIIISRLLVCVYINKININFHAQDYFNFKIDNTLANISKKIQRIDDYFSSVLWDVGNNWDAVKKWDSRKVILDSISSTYISKITDSVFYGTLWDKNISFDRQEHWDKSSVKLEDRIIFNKENKTNLKDSVRVDVSSKDTIRHFQETEQFDYYNPVSLYWDNKEKFDKAVRKVYGNRWDLKAIAEIDKINASKTKKYYDMFEIDIEEKTTLFNPVKTLKDFYNPFGLCWNDKEHWDNKLDKTSTIENIWDGSKPRNYEIVSKNCGKVLTDSIKVTENLGDSLVVVRYNLNRKQIERITI